MKDLKDKIITQLNKHDLYVPFYEEANRNTIQLVTDTLGSVTIFYNDKQIGNYNLSEEKLYLKQTCETCGEFCDEQGIFVFDGERICYSCATTYVSERMFDYIDEVLENYQIYD